MFKYISNVIGKSVALTNVVTTVVLDVVKDEAVDCAGTYYEGKVSQTQYIAECDAAAVVRKAARADKMSGVVDNKKVYAKFIASRK